MITGLLLLRSESCGQQEKPSQGVAPWKAIQFMYFYLVSVN